MSRRRHKPDWWSPARKRRYRAAWRVAAKQRAIRKQQRRSAAARRGWKRRRSKGEVPYVLCDAGQRGELYDKVVEDFDRIVGKTPAHERGEYVVTFEFGGGSELASVRRFRDFRRLKAFLTVGERGQGKSGVDWSPDEGLCQYPKRVSIARTDKHGHIAKRLKSFKVKNPRV